jgi:hypothetical protein
MIVKHVPVNELQSWWAFVKKGLEIIKRKSSEDWIPEDIYANCLFGKSLLWVFIVDNKPVAFAVLLPEGETVHVWCGWTSVPGMLDQYIAETEKILRSMNYTKISFSSWRPGWDKVAYKHGFRPRLWVKEL